MEVVVAATPTVRRLRLGAELRRLREVFGPTAEEVASRLEWSPSKLSRIETAKIGVRVSDVRLLLELYQVDEVHMGEILALAQSATESGWWTRYRDALTEKFAAYVALEDEANAALTYETYVIPGLLQCEDYARRTMETSRVIAALSPRDIARRVEVRRRRQELLTKENPLALSAIMDESVLLRVVGSKDVMRKQLKALVELSALPNVEIFVLPLGVHREPIVSESFTLLEFAPAYDVSFPDIAHIENLSVSVEVQDDGITHMYRRSWEALRRAALPSDESIRRISALSEHAAPR
ncbi:helix-turn-helix domain-containing protein [Actinomadura soli]|uniref:Helix-turn-helix domain-containing protein n=1 Tax=Actinomadura soli TaxID=2508997 RepID=A0A5C4J430_9ACTN|nr:helix-turn-helix transcriptional regulator [Actinomadura soli]TMQ91618.1 helix-turn-helix domain-containing protein [Actinomadura soli]